ncbi:WD40-repeat-containing domain protein [Thamnocephalis sphaerospora]|uniref:WD40-repeat-containing domain protein n=1 Tax=Thamnocephalis sphaerospora TaxID=78915 RepID=A0A4P9XJP0_9FUNG|nr:WD40-repeat-containing domain protein [Thamnocephalis sphaerospora]|eukprot:RKP05983.1 WD40-repeat-containing domain protein [Thamnocephalis sphaerospora]
MLRRLQEREIKGPGGTPLHFINSMYATGAFVARLRQSDLLDSHEGCVNALSWSSNGQRLVSGSDDTQICIWNASDYSLACKIATGHRANIFSAKFMPHSGDATVVCCAGDAEIRVFDVHYSQSRAVDERARLRHVFRCHSDRAKRIVTEDNPSCFLSCSEDGTVRHFDLRQPHSCSEERCPAALLDFSPYDIDLNGLSRNTHHPDYLAVCGTNPYIYLHDRRMIRDAVTGCVRRFMPGSSDGRRGHVTAVKFGEASGREVGGRR